MLQLHFTPDLRSNQVSSSAPNVAHLRSQNRSRLIPRDPKLGGVVLALCDVFVLLGSMALVGVLLLYSHTEFLASNLPHFFVTSLLSFFLLHAFAQSYAGENLSRISRISGMEFILKPVALTCTAITFAYVVETLLGRSTTVSQSHALVSTLSPEAHFIYFATFVVCIERGLIYMLLGRLQAAGRLSTNVVLFGAGPIGQRLMRVVREEYADSVRVLGIFDDRVRRVPPEIYEIPVEGGIDQLVSLVQNMPSIDKVLVALPMNAESRILQLLTQLRHLPIDVALVPEFVGMRIDKQVIRDAHPPILSVSRRPMSGLGRVVKRCFDFIIALGMLILLAPILAIAACAIKIDSPGPIWFRQPRTGFNNKQFDVLKFRSMYQDCSDLEARQQTQRNDARITRIGAWLRLTSIDELPQLFNVLRGDMSLVGPRPHALGMQVGNRMCDEIVREYAVRHRMKPGITGWAQVRGLRGAVDRPSILEARVHHDIFYIDNWSFFFDLKILTMTIIELVRPRNAF